MIADRGCQAITAPTDISRREAIEALGQRAIDARGRIDVWVNVAGIIVKRPVMEAVEDEVDRMLAVNLKGVYWCCAVAGRAMRDSGGGSIINLSSSGADSVIPGLSLYALTKASVNMITRTCAKEFGPHGIRVNAIAPGWVDTPMGTHGFVGADGKIDPDKREAGLRQREQASPLGITGVPRDIALGALYLASDASRFVTGQIMRINGGVSMP
jgi:3-oxoacyl-[acyl-carrier protein] reductase